MNSPELENKLLIESILQKNEADFEDFLKSSEFRKTEFPMKEQMLQFLVPKRILELAQNPEKVKVDKLGGSSPHSLWLSISESDREFESEDSQTKADYQLVLALSQREVKSKEFIFLTIQLASQVADRIPEAVTVGQYWDNPTLRKLGMTGDFYKKLDDFCAKLGFEYLIGENDSQNVDYFKNTLGRKRLIDEENFWILNPQRDGKGKKIFPPSERITFKKLQQH